MLLESLGIERKRYKWGEVVAKESTQRAYMLKLIARYGLNQERVVREYASAEERGDVERKSNTHRWTTEQYARALWRDGVRRGWISGGQVRR